MACEADRYESFIDAAGKRQRRLVGGITYTTQKIISEAPPSIAGLVSRFVRDHGLNELTSIQSTFDTQTKWVLEPLMAADLSKPGVDFSNLRKRPHNRLRDAASVGGAEKSSLDEAHRFIGVMRADAARPDQHPVCAG